LYLKKSTAAIFLALTAATSIASATVISFEDIKFNNGDPAEVADGYRGFNWDNIWASRSNYSRELDYGLVSGTHMGFMSTTLIPATFSNDAPFSFNSINIAKMYADGSTRFNGYVGDTLAYTKEVFSTRGISELVEFNWTGLTRVEIVAADGMDRVAFDDLTVNEQVAAVPEPTSISMLLLGFGLVAASRKYKKKV
jgi:hypothetical protein